MSYSRFCRKDKSPATDKNVQKNCGSIDLHVHTTASDGHCTPAEIIGMAMEKGLSYLAITDHDTMEGLAPAKEALREYNPCPLILIPGVELSTLWGEQEIHILGYCLNENHPLIIEKLADLARARVGRAEKIVSRLNQLGYPVSMEEVRQKSPEGTLGRPHIALVLKEHGFISSIEEGFERFLNPGCPAYVPRLKISPPEAIDLIRTAGGVPVIAHPGLDFPLDILPACLKAGLGGIEVYHPHHTPEREEFYLALSREKELLATGGSDFHGHEKEEYDLFGTKPVPFSTVEALVSLCSCSC